MKSVNHLLLLVTAVVASFVAPPAAAHHDDDATALCPATVPAAVRPAPDQRLRYARPAAGVQVYMCTADASGATAWTFIAPQANLFDRDDELIATHFIGPVWQDNDGSAVKGAKAGGATVDPTAVPWLLLTSVGNTGPGRLAHITSIQRLDTVGGIAPPSAECTPETLGRIAQVPYTATYFFYDTHEGDNAQCR